MINLSAVPWSERANAVWQSMENGELKTELICEGSLLDVATTFFGWRPHDLAAIRVILPQRFKARRSFQGAALVAMVAASNVERLRRTREGLGVYSRHLVDQVDDEPVHQMPRLNT